MWSVDEVNYSAGMELKTSRKIWATLIREREKGNVYLQGESQSSSPPQRHILPSECLCNHRGSTDTRHKRKRQREGVWGEGKEEDDDVSGNMKAGQEKRCNNIVSEYVVWEREKKETKGWSSKKPSREWLRKQEETKEWCEREPLEKSQLWVWIHPNANQSFKHSRNSRGKEKSSSNTSAVCCFSFLECICTWEKVGVTCLPLGRRNRWPLPPHRHRPVDPEHGRYSGWFGWGSNKSMRTHAFNGFAVNAHARPSLLIQMIMLEKKQ